MDPKISHSDVGNDQAWQEKKLDGRDILLKLLLEMGKLPTISEHVVRRLSHFEQEI